MNIAEPDVFAFDAQFQQHVEAGDTRRATAGRDDLDVLKGFLRDEDRVLGGRADNDGGAVLIIVEHRDVHAFAADPFDDETVGGLDVFEIDRAKGRFHRADEIGQLFGVGFVQFDIETVDVGEFLEEHGLALHHRFRGQRADVAKPQHRRAI